MAGSGSSSKRKLSKRKSVKISSQKKKKKSQRKESKKSRRDYDSVSSYSDDESERSLSPTSKVDYKKRASKHKKLRRGRSVSSYSDDQSINSDSDSLSTHDSSYKNKKSRRSRTKSKKVTKKRHDSPDSDAKTNKNRRKKKESSRDRVVKPRKKSSKKKKSKKYLSSSDSESFNRNSSSSSADRKRKRSKITIDEEIDRPRGRESYKTYKKHKTRSPSCSSRGTGRDHSVSVDHSDGALAPVNNSRRLRSVITFVDRSNDAGENKEEIVYDYDDYPSPKSMDSNEGGNTGELDDSSAGAFDNKFRVENVVGEKITELGKSGIDEDDQKNVDINKLEKEKQGLGADDLELILRQKALENLRKFRGVSQTGSRSTDNPKMNNESDVNDPSPGKVNITRTKSTNQSNSNAREINQSSEPTLQRDSSCVDTKNQPNSGHIEQEPGMAKEASDHAPGGPSLLGLSEEDEGKAKRIIGNDASPGSGAINACSSSTTKPTSSEGQSQEEQQNEAKDGSEFKQKTMSVMRGGEMVQVSYKVYIPQKAPALARRQLRR